MSSIKRTSLNRDTTINIESIKKNYIFINWIYIYIIRVLVLNK